MKTIGYTLAAAIIAFTTSTAMASSSFLPFKTELEASQHCPNPNQLSFTPASTVVTKKGKVTGIYNGQQFVSIGLDGSHNVARPKNMSFGNLLVDAHYRQTNGNYGYVSGAKTTCLYSYTSFLARNYNLVVRD